MFDAKKLDRIIDRLINDEDIEESSELVETAAVLTRLGEARPDERRRAELKELFLAHGREIAKSRAVKPARGARRRLSFARRVAAIATALTLSTGSVVYAASGSMPDSPLYPVKRVAEAAALSVAPGNIRERLETAFAQTRVREARYLLEQTGEAANHSEAIKLLKEARAAGDRGLKNQVDELLEKVDAPERSRPKKDEPTAPKTGKEIQPPTDNQPEQTAPQNKKTDKPAPKPSPKFRQSPTLQKNTN